MQLSLALIFIFAVVEFFVAACAAMGVSFTNAARSSTAFRQSVLFRVHEGVNIISDFPLKVGGDSASCSTGEIIPFQELCDVWPISSKYRRGNILNFKTLYRDGRSRRVHKALWKIIS